ncbi:MarR family winged helix-turn-helix transcriptional regulator [Shewanella sp. 10N.286.54.B9]|uniref:MarR family winged helix-turn-helix transcriptional regulator n=1 Tax=Shewanella sp. 10N.286.54.B9 TaxID=3229719 RepID=UPI003550AFAB
MSGQKPLDSLFNLAHTLKRKIHDHLEEMQLGIAPMHVRVLKIINAKTPCTAVDIANFLDRDKAQVTRLLNTLIAQELIIKQPNPEDKRSQCLEVTATGKEITNQITEINKQIFSQMAAGISEQQLESFMAVTDKMMHNLAAQPDKS